MYKGIKLYQYFVIIGVMLLSNNLFSQGKDQLLSMLDKARMLVVEEDYTNALVIIRETILQLKNIERPIIDDVEFIDFETISIEYNKNESRANLRYKDKRFLVEGEISEISDKLFYDVSKGLVTLPTITLNYPGGDYESAMILYFDEMDREDISVFDVGQTIKVECTILGKRGGDYHISAVSCILR